MMQCEFKKNSFHLAVLAISYFSLFSISGFHPRVPFGLMWLILQIILYFFSYYFRHNITKHFLKKYLLMPIKWWKLFVAVDSPPCGFFYWFRMNRVYTWRNWVVWLQWRAVDAWTACAGGMCGFDAKSRYRHIERTRISGAVLDVTHTCEFPTPDQTRF